ncbi:leucine-rich repeat domain-containing protein [Bacteroides cellulosilyticus]|uniref:leucine-rich repeat domain-containing protein n=1 Tax=Bacteroides cellulosilyticus TaxID=246787 RepID=UPI0015F4982A|nr:fimbrillin family protein [Bacteroides cellulosilyticus]
MNKIKYITHILTVITFFSCTEEELFKNKEEIEVTAGFATTRTTFTEDNGTTHVTWNTEDAIGLFTKEQNNLQYTALNEGNEAKFDATWEKLKAVEGETVYAYYPHSYQTDNLQRIKLPNLISQYYQENASKQDFIYASGNIINNKLSLRFKHVFAFLKITIPLELIADRGEKGGLIIKSSEDISCDSYFDLEKKEITSDKFNVIWYYIPMDKELTDKRNVTCYIAVLPQTKEAELKIYNASNGSEEKCLLVKNAPLEGFKAGNVYTLYLNETEADIEKDALVALYKATNGDYWKNRTNWCSDKPVSEWYGVTINPTGTVRDIQLTYNNLSGILPEEIGNLKELDFLNLYGNSLSGNIPNSITKSKLSTLWLANNQLSGDISVVLEQLMDLKQNLISLDLSNNKFSGSISTSIGNFTKLRYLRLGNNQLSGNIPIELGNLSNLIQLILGNNKLSGSIPKTIGNLTKLQTLYLANNRLTGNIPPEIGNMLSLETFDIGSYTAGSEGGDMEIGPGGEIITGRSKNEITGSIPKELCRLSNLKSFVVINNLLSGEMPNEIWNIPKLEVLLVSENNFSGTLSEDIGNAKNLKQLWLYNNNFSGELPSTITKLVKLKELLLGNNSFSGELPKDIGFMAELRQISCNNNLFTGTIPVSICNLINLEMLELGNAYMGNGIPLENFNKFSGEIPANIGNLKKLYHFSISDNNIGGIIPKSIGKLVELRNFSIANNKIEGTLPKEIGNMKNIDTFNADNNSIGGIIPRSITDLITLRSFSIHNNKVEGTIPEAMGKLKKLDYFSVSNNNIEGNVPETFADLPELRCLIVKNNRLHGIIPRRLLQSPKWQSWDPEIFILPQQSGYILTIE